MADVGLAVDLLMIEPFTFSQQYIVAPLTYRVEAGLVERADRGKGVRAKLQNRSGEAERETRA